MSLFERRDPRVIYVEAFLHVFSRIFDPIFKQNTISIPSFFFFFSFLKYLEGINHREKGTS